MLNSILLTELLELFGVILTSTVSSKNLQLLTTLILSLHSELLEFIKHLVFKLNKGYPCHSCEFINK